MSHQQATQVKPDLLLLSREMLALAGFCMASVDVVGAWAMMVMMSEG
jgi:hypothetical protein